MYMFVLQTCHVERPGVSLANTFIRLTSETVPGRINTDGIRRLRKAFLFHVRKNAWGNEAQARNLPRNAGR